MEIVKLKSSDFAIASEQLSAAFSQDPLVGYFLPESNAKKLAALKSLSQALLTYGRPYNHIYTTVDRPKGASIWLPPAAFQITGSQLWQVVTSGLVTVPFHLRWDRIIDFIAFMTTEVRLHHKTASEPHWYLAMLGVSPECQGQGIGGKLLQPVLQEADQSNMPCYLETSTTAAVRFYQRHGFELTHHGRVSDRDYWTMKRRPQVGLESN